MYPRLYLARNLLREDGLLFVSVDDGEVENCRRVLTEVFGEDNFLATFVWKRKAGGADYYLERLDKTSLTYNKAMDFPIECPDGTFVSPPQPDPSKPSTSWRWGKGTVVERRSELIFEKDKKTGEWRVYTRTWEPTDGVTPRSLLVDKEHGRNRDGTQEVDALIGPKVFSNPKPTRLLAHLLEIGAKDSNALVLDFFAGSGSLADALLSMNSKDGGRRRFLLVQLPQPTGRDDYLTISAITKERVRRAIQKLDDSKAGQMPIAGAPPRDHGFRVFKLAESNLRPWSGATAGNPAALGEQLDLHVGHIRPNRTSQDILYEILLKSGFPLTTSVEPATLEGKAVSSVAGGALLDCLEPELTIELVRALADRRPERVVFLDAGFAGKDQLKANAVQIFRSKGVTSFKTV
jgi:adenine-specific DNA-methyltransferase